MSVLLSNLTPLTPHFGIESAEATMKRLNSRICIIDNEIACVYTICNIEKATYEKAAASTLMRSAFGLFGLPELHCAKAMLSGKSKRAIFLTRIYYEPETSLMLQPGPLKTQEPDRDALLRLSAVHAAFGYDLGVRQLLVADGVYYPSSYLRSCKDPDEHSKLTAQLEKLHDGFPRLFCDILGITSSRELIRWRARTETILSSNAKKLGGSSSWALEAALSRIAEYARSRLAFLRETESEKILEDPYGLVLKSTSGTRESKS